MAIVLTVEFDYNKQTFVPSHPPRLIKLSKFVREYPDMAVFLVKPNYIVMLVECKGKQGVATYTDHFPLSPHLPVPGGSWAEIVEEMLHEAGMLTSSIFSSWEPMQKKNVETQLKLVRQSPHYRHFIVNALRIKTLQPRHKSHVVMIHVKLGLGLGQIVKLPDYQVSTFQEVKNKLQERVGPTQAWKWSQDWLNLETHPELLKAQKQDPTIVRLPILFDIQSTILMEPIFFRIPNVVNDVVSKPVADAKARECFSGLGMISSHLLTSISHP